MGPAGGLARGLALLARGCAWSKVGSAALHFLVWFGERDSQVCHAPAAAASVVAAPTVAAAVVLCRVVLWMRSSPIACCGIHISTYSLMCLAGWLAALDSDADAKANKDLRMARCMRGIADSQGAMAAM